MVKCSVGEFLSPMVLVPWRYSTWDHKWGWSNFTLDTVLLEGSNSKPMPAAPGLLKKVTHTWEVVLANKWAKELNWTRVLATLAPSLAIFKISQFVKCHRFLAFSRNTTLDKKSLIFYLSLTSNSINLMELFFCRFWTKDKKRKRYLTLKAMSKNRSLGELLSLDHFKGLWIQDKYMTAFLLLVYWRTSQVPVSLHSTIEHIKQNLQTIFVTL